jgi:hypothetical protein
MSGLSTARTDSSLVIFVALYQVTYCGLTAAYDRIYTVQYTIPNTQFIQVSHCIGDVISIVAAASTPVQYSLGRLFRTQLTGILGMRPIDYERKGRYLLPIVQTNRHKRRHVDGCYHFAFVEIVNGIDFIGRRYPKRTTDA